MNETRAIIQAFDQSQAKGERCALATVVDVEGSAYRRPGARMLVCESGKSTGTISAGCLENDVIEHAQRIINTPSTELIEYDAGSTNEEIVWGLGLGCNGVVRVLVEPLEPQSSYIKALRRLFAADSNSSPLAVATVFQHSISWSMPTIGSRVIVNDNKEINCGLLKSDLAALIVQDTYEALLAEQSGVRVYERNGNTTKVFIETITPPVQLVVFGAGHDALPVIELANGLGWHTEIIDVQARPASRALFAAADKVTLARTETISEHLTITPRTLTLLMTHNYAHDQALLKFLLMSASRYIGVMGPRKRTERMRIELAEKDSRFKLKEADCARLYAPIGLDIGANSPQEIALSIIAEMRAIVAKRKGGHLCYRQAPIHDAYDTILDGSGTKNTQFYARQG
ncbi:MAG: XdhC family protein [Methylobacter sp.]|nr:XdhC family protein [Methylobacter sp.]